MTEVDGLDDVDLVDRRALHLVHDAHSTLAELLPHDVDGPRNTLSGLIDVVRGGV